MSEYFQVKPAWQFWGVLGGFIWGRETVFNFVALQAERVGPAVSNAIGQGATMVSAVCSVVMGKQFSSAPAATRNLIPAMFLFFLLGLGFIAIAPMIPR